MCLDQYDFSTLVWDFDEEIMLYELDPNCGMCLLWRVYVVVKISLVWERYLFVNSCISTSMPSSIYRWRYLGEQAHFESCGTLLADVAKAPPLLGEQVCWSSIFVKPEWSGRPRFERVDPRMIWTVQIWESGPQLAPAGILQLFGAFDLIQVTLWWCYVACSCVWSFMGYFFSSMGLPLYFNGPREHFKAQT